MIVPSRATSSMLQVETYSMLVTYTVYKTGSGSKRAGQHVRHDALIFPGMISMSKKKKNSCPYVERESTVFICAAKYTEDLMFCPYHTLKRWMEYKFNYGTHRKRKCITVNSICVMNKANVRILN